jgi:hypothetical protein
MFITVLVTALYWSDRSPQWLEIKNPAAPAVKREAEEDWAAEYPWRHADSRRSTAFCAFAELYSFSVADSQID